MSELDKQIQYAMVDSFLIDCLLSDNHEFESEVTEFPVESGSDITDNVRRKPIVVTMECIISGDPIGDVATARRITAQFGSPVFGSDPVADAYAYFKSIYDTRRQVTIRTSLETFTNMVMKDLSIPRSADNNKASLRFTAVFQQVLTVENRRFVRTAIPGAKPNTTTTKPPVPLATNPMAGIYIQIDTKTLDWFDPDIKGWRRSAKQVGTSTFASQTQPGKTVTQAKWRLVRGFPLGFQVGDSGSDTYHSPSLHKDGFYRTALDIIKSGHGGADGIKYSVMRPYLPKDFTSVGDVRNVILVDNYEIFNNLGV